MPDLEICENYFMGLQHELCPPTASLFFNGHLFLVGAFISRWRCENATSDGVHACSAAVVNAYVNDLFQRIITCDAEATVASWDIESGSKEFSFQLEEVGQTVTAFALDLSQRRVAIGYSNGLAYVVTANSGSILTVIEKEHLEGGCLFLSFLTLFGSKKLVGCSGRKTVVLFEEVSGNRMRFDRNFVGHNENIINVICLKGTSLLTVGSERELFLWSVSQQNPTVRFQLPFDPTTASDLPNSEKLFLAGDVAGNIHLMSVESPRPLKSIDVFGMSIKSSITAITLHNFCVYIGNLHGYMKVMTISERNEFEELMMFRPHTMSIINISVSQKTGVVVTSSADQEIRLWSVEPFALIGHLGKPGKWSLRNPNTWKGNWSIEIDPMHFAKPEPPVVVEEEEEEEEEEPEVEEVPELPIFTFNAANSLFKESDEIIESGRELKEKLEMDIRREAKSARIIKPVVAKLNFTELIEARHMENTRPYVESCRSIRPSPRHFRI